jgi:hypothetical protein
MDDADTPSTQSSGFLVPPTKIPRTALAVATPPPPPGARVRRAPRRRTPFAGVADVILDAVDGVADVVATGLGLRPR